MNERENAVMPELPEVETVVRGLTPDLKGATITHLTCHRPNLRFPFPDQFSDQVTGQSVTGLTRRAKYILIHLSNDMTWLIHLGMSGSFRKIDDATDLRKHDHVDVRTGSHRYVYHDPRRFGFMDLIPTQSLAQSRWLKDLGIEPLSSDMSGDALAHLYKNKKSPIKTALMDQRLVVGVGNIYACESLFMAGIHPERAAMKISKKRLDLLSDAVQTVLSRAIESGGSSLKDYRNADGELGYFQHAFQVYDREGHPSPKDPKAKIKRIVQSGRSTFYCPSSQK